MKFNLLLLFIFLMCAQIKAQTLPMPEATVVGSTTEAYYSVMFPIGWSGDGKFCYVSQDINGLPQEVYSYKLIVQDMITDSVLLERKIEYDFQSCKDCRQKYAHIINADTMVYHPSFFQKVVWPDMKNDVMKTFLDYQVVPVNHDFEVITNDLKGFPLKLSEKKIFTTASASCVSEYSIRASKQNEEKQVHYSRYNCGESGQINDFRIVGFFKSLFEERTALVVLEHISVDGKTQTRPLIIGVHLFKGFTVK